MYKIKKEQYGVKMTFEGFVKPDIMQNWVDESKKIVPTLKPDFNVFVDMRKMNPLSKESQHLMEEGQKIYKSKGMKRSVVILDSATLTMQFKRIAKETGIYQWERYVDASKHSDWDKLGTDWLKNGTDPDTL